MRNLCIAVCALGMLAPMGCMPPSGEPSPSVTTDPALRRLSEDLRGAVGEDEVRSRRLRLAEALLQQAAPGEALEVLAPELAARTPARRAFVLAGLAHRDRDDPGAAEAILERGAGIFPHDPQIRLHLGKAHAAAGHDDLAERECHAALSLNPTVPIAIAAHLALVAIYKHSAQEDRARAHYDAAVGLEPAVARVMREAEMARITPPPVVAGSDELHPEWSVRIEAVEKEIETILRERGP